MKQRAPRPYPAATVTPKGERAILAGHPWVYDAELELPEVANGSLVDVLSRKGAYLGTGLVSQRSKIRVRLVTRNANDRMDAAFWERKVRWAWEHRKTVMGEDAHACRLVFSEADGFPGLTVDRFSDVLVTQTLSVGMELLKPVIFPALVRVLAEDGVGVRGIYERNDASTRKLEGLAETCGWWSGSLDAARARASAAPVEGTVAPSAGTDKSAVTDTCDGVAARGIVPEPAGMPCLGDAALDPVPASELTQELLGSTSTEIRENGVRYVVDFEHGQKTGFFLDQKYNRRAVARLARGKRVLDCFTHTGSFALNAAAGGAERVHAVDISELAVEQARANARLNGFENRMECTAANVFDLLGDMERDRSRRERYDFIVLDPPAFTKSRRTVDSATRGYKEINYRAMRLLPRGGYLATCSCSHFMDTERFRRMLASAAHDAGVQLRQVEERQQAPDHPIVWGVPETDYLKFFLFQVV